jgi:hypothetical protein
VFCILRMAIAFELGPSVGGNYAIKCFKYDRACFRQDERMLGTSRREIIN